MPLLALIICLVLLLHGVAVVARLLRAGLAAGPLPRRWWAPTRIRTVTALGSDVLGLLITQPLMAGAGHAVWLAALVVTALGAALAGWTWPRLLRSEGTPWVALVELALTVLLLIPFALAVR